MEKPTYNNDLNSNSKPTCIEISFANLPIEKTKLSMRSKLKFMSIFFFFEKDVYIRFCLTITLVYRCLSFVYLLISINII